MSDPASQPAEVKLARPRARLRLGCRDDIGVMGGGVPKGATEVTVYTGFDKRTKDGEWVKHFLKRKTRNAQGLTPQEYVDKVLLPEFRADWDEEAKKPGVLPARQGKVSPPAKTDEHQVRTMEEIVLAELDMWWERKCYTLNTFRGYKYAAKSFLEHSRELAKTPGYVYTKKDIPGIVGRMAANTNKNTKGPSQLMRNTKYVLRRIRAFPSRLVKEFEVTKPDGRLVREAKQAYPLTSKERAIIWRNLPKADRETRGILLMTMNSTQQAVDIGMTKVKKLKEACEELCMDGRHKTDVYYRLVAWGETKAWLDAMEFGEDDIFAFKSVVYSRKELKDPDINRKPLNESNEEAETRRDNAADRAAKLVKKFLVEVCDIKRPGVSIHSFRHTNVSEWEVQGFPRILSMALSGHLTEESFLNYASAAVEYLKKVISHTHDFWAHADRERVLIFTKSQLYEALVVVIQKESAKVIAAMKDDHAAQDAKMLEEHATQLQEMRKEHEYQLGEMRKDHAAQDVKLDWVMGILRSFVAVIMNRANPHMDLLPTLSPLIGEAPGWNEVAKFLTKVESADA